MLEGIKRWFSGGASSDSKPALQEFGAWAAARQYVVRTPKEGEGIIVDGKQGQLPWRLEWGASQRPYVDGNELRIRAEMGLPSDLQVLVINKLLAEAMEKAVF